MRAKVVANVPAKYFFNKITESVIEDIKQQTGTVLSRSQLKDFSFDKKFANGQYGKLEVTDFKDDELYAYEMHSGKNAHKVSYRIKPLGEKKSELSYVEHVSGSSATVDLNNKLTGFILGWVRRKRLKQMGKKIEEFYQQTLANTESN
ncbi:hypothetical protein FC62_GL000793 [Amylolactobacillus amylotrophicus DSM 20534]|uniref:Uncharacterized protein n=3 Tax=Amylolactobacillus TaxID=2767876 RepID=A0A0R1YST6_9LACO|nr:MULTISPECIES: DUF3284 domain-containing protein [Amylolactobacillus]APT18248.1 hypothetical protein LA20533_02685 [Amylolactobacillus amylophilus DSM 20533 = JCM 1125]KRK38024.1 hypothetical protein FC62_GL000793 [Amylolactobacillus amylotrophicus DSM 20534]KRM42284.1 hypothetical protein FD40_GL001070 [Amylolactobacillus amylophilus DSM 20533 = JCM 1125]GED80162.1 hypothetical protein LAM01_06350 [Amylolactobacillus amylophilus]